MPCVTHTHTHSKEKLRPILPPCWSQERPQFPKGTSNCVSNSTTPNGATMPCRHSTSCHWRALPKPVSNIEKTGKTQEKKKNTYLFPQPPFSFKHPPPALAVQLIRVGGTIFCRTFLFRWSGRSRHPHSKEKQKDARGATSDTMLHRNKWSPRSLRQARPGRGGVAGWGVKGPSLSQSVTDSVGEGGAWVTPGPVKAEKIQRSELKSNRIEGALRKGQLGRHSEMASMSSLFVHLLSKFSLCLGRWKEGPAMFKSVGVDRLGQVNQRSWPMRDSTQPVSFSQGLSEPRASGFLAGDGKFTIFIILIAVVDPICCLFLSSSSFLCCSLEACNAFANSWSSSSSCQLSGWSMTHVSPWKVLCSRFFLASPGAARPQ